MHSKKGMVLATLLLTMIVCASLKMHVVASSADDEDSLIIVSMGDSYSSGEGIEPFYGQNKEASEKVNDEDWLAHRSTKSWPGLLTLSELDGTFADYKDINWFFVASSGATTANIIGVESGGELQEKTYNKSQLSGTYYMPSQIEIFDQFEQDTVDYVTLTIGGNDVGFADIIATSGCILYAGSSAGEGTSAIEMVSLFGAAYCDYLLNNKLEDELDKIWDDFYGNSVDDDESTNSIKYDICETYETIATKAGANAEIIVAGYPRLISEDGAWCGVLISSKHATLINENVSRFNDALEEIVNCCSDYGLNIYFVSVEEAFEGHEAYTEDAYINNIIFKAQDQDLDDSVIPSDYSIHPNETGAQIYAQCVQAKIDELEAEKEAKLSEEIAALDVIHFDGTVNTPDEVVLKYFDAVSDGDYETATSCYSPSSEKMLNFIGNIGALISNGVSGKNSSWSDLLLEETGGVNFEVVECYIISEETNYGISFIDTWLPRIYGLRVFSGTDAEVYVKYRYYDDGKYKVVEETCNVHRYTGYGWRMCL